MNKVFFEPSLLPMSIAAPPPALLGKSDQLTLREPPLASCKKGGRGTGGCAPGPQASRGGGGIRRSWPMAAPLLFAAAHGSSCSIAWLLRGPLSTQSAGADGASRGL